MEHESLETEAAAEELVGRDAVVTAVEAMDHNRGQEIDRVVDGSREAIREVVDIDGLGSLSRDGDAWDETLAELSSQGEERLSGELTALKERVERPYPSLVRLRFETDEPLDFVPGQYVRITYEDEEPRVYSVASSPNADHVELCIRRVPGGHLTPTLCDQTEVGDELFVRGPYGDEFTLQEPSPRDMVFVATGTGVAPFKSMIDYTFEEGRDEVDGERRDVWLFLGASWEDHLPYHEAFTDLAAERDNFHYVPTLSREEYLTDWDGETDYVQQTVPKYVDEDAVSDPVAAVQPWLSEAPATDVEARIDPTSMEVYVCGIGAMVAGVVDVVEGFELPSDLLRSESYG
jgi:CDP-4-dehydro-6-deoxyglucose reductase